MQKATKDILKQIDKLFASKSKMHENKRGQMCYTAKELRQFQAIRELWAVLTALRGPDTENDFDKAATTQVIRSTAFPKTDALDQKGIANVPAAFGHDSVTRAIHRRERMAADHFRSHTQLAFKALGLKWNEENE